MLKAEGNRVLIYFIFVYIVWFFEADRTLINWKCVSVGYRSRSVS